MSYPSIFHSYNHGHSYGSRKTHDHPQVVDKTFPQLERRSPVTLTALARVSRVSVCDLKAKCSHGVENSMGKQWLP